VRCSTDPGEVVFGPFQAEKPLQIVEALAVFVLTRRRRSYSGPQLTTVVFQLGDDAVIEIRRETLASALLIRALRFRT
jgi:hypothetical protein